MPVDLPSSMLSVACGWSVLASSISFFGFFSDEICSLPSELSVGLAYSGAPLALPIAALVAASSLPVCESCWLCCLLWSMGGSCCSDLLTLPLVLISMTDE